MKRMKTNKKYEKARNKLIPFAERYANEICGEKGPIGMPEAREEWTIKWNQAFLMEMDRLAIAQGLVIALPIKEAI